MATDYWRHRNSCKHTTSEQSRSLPWLGLCLIGRLLLVASLPIVFSFQFLYALILHLSLGSEHFVQVLPQMIVADQAILSIAPKKRLCYLSEEKPLAFYKYYSQVILLPVGSAQTVLLKVRPTSATTFRIHSPSLPLYTPRPVLEMPSPGSPFSKLKPMYCYSIQRPS